MPLMEIYVEYMSRTLTHQLMKKTVICTYKFKGEFKEHAKIRTQESELHLQIDAKMIQSLRNKKFIISLRSKIHLHFHRQKLFVFVLLQFSTMYRIVK